MSTSPDLPEALQRAELGLARTGKSAGKLAGELLGQVSDAGGPWLAAITAAKAEAGLDSDELERLLIWHAAQQAIGKVPALPLDAAVKVMLEEDLRQMWAMKAPLTAGSYHFARAAKIATLRRFPCGPMEWEMSGIPRSWVLQAGFPGSLRLLAMVARRLGGFQPCFFMHVAPAPRTRGLSVEKLVLRSYYRMARSLELQPKVRALIACAWFHDPAAVKDYPHLETLSRPYLTGGGLIVRLGRADAGSGVSEGNAQRKADYEAGKRQYRYGLAIWPRSAAVKWAQDHPELGE